MESPQCALWSVTMRPIRAAREAVTSAKDAVIDAAYDTGQTMRKASGTLVVVSAVSLVALVVAMLALAIAGEKLL